MITEIIFPGSIPGNNGPNGLLRMRGKDKTRLRNQFQLIIMATTRHQHKGAVRLELVRHSIGGPMDEDNLWSTGKLPIDAMKNVGLIIDDKKSIIVERSYTQTRALNQKSQMTVIRIIDL